MDERTKRYNRILGKSNHQIILQIFKNDTIPKYYWGVDNLVKKLLHKKCIVKHDGTARWTGERRIRIQHPGFPALKHSHSWPPLTSIPKAQKFMADYRQKSRWIFIDKEQE